MKGFLKEMLLILDLEVLKERVMLMELNKQLSIEQNANKKGVIINLYELKWIQQCM